MSLFQEVTLPQAASMYEGGVALADIAAVFGWPDASCAAYELLGFYPEDSEAADDLNAFLEQ